MNIPIYRAKKIDNDEYVIFNSFYEYENKYYAINKIINQTIDGWFTHVMIPLTYKIDSTTLAIHFSDMLDSQGNKIFASLQEDGKGGDYTNCEELPVIFCWDSLNACVCLKGKYEYTALFKDGSTNSKNTTFNEYTIIGIQE